MQFRQVKKFLIVSKSSFSDAICASGTQKKKGERYTAVRIFILLFIWNWLSSILISVHTGLSQGEIFNCIYKKQNPQRDTLNYNFITISVCVNVVFFFLTFVQLRPDVISATKNCILNCLIFFSWNHLHKKKNTLDKCNLGWRR